MNPLHQFKKSGTYKVTLTVSNSYGTNTISKNITINVISTGINISGDRIVNHLLQFNTTPSGNTTILWNFGDGYLSSLQNPFHTFGTPGTYIVTLTVSNIYCTAIYYDTLNIINVGIDELKDVSSILFYPNPFSDEIKISYNLLANRKISIQVFDVLGNVVQTPVENQTQTPSTYSYTIRNLTQSVYFVRFIADDTIVVYKIVSIY